MVKIFFPFFLLFFAFLLSSCTSHVFLTSSQCRPSDKMFFSEKMTHWYVKRDVDFRYYRQAKIQNFWGTLFYPKEKGAIDICDLSFHQNSTDIRITTRFTLEDVLWGLIPGNSIRTVEVRGVFDKQVDFP